MAKSQGQKMKILRLMELFYKETDPEHPLSMQDIVDYLIGQGIKAERKSIYDDIDALREFGLDIVYRKERPSGYYLASRTFELVELKLLIDSVISSKFITVNKTKALLEKLITLCSEHEAGLMTREIYVPGRIKSMNESIYYNIDFIHEAITDKVQLSFQYITYSKDMSKQFRHDGKRYVVSPFALLRDNENYYLVAYDAESETMKHYRVDRMDRPRPTDLPQEGEEIFSEMDMSSYTTDTFGMFGGTEERVCLRFTDDLLDVAFDRFGSAIKIQDDSPGMFRFWADVVISQQFFAWIFALGGKAVILEPPAARLGMERQLRKFAEQQLVLNGTKVSDLF